nr:M15 family metallopeptidase [Oculatella sp. LEGE 06141]
MPGKPPEFSTPPTDDIPEALRETAVASPRPRFKLPFWGWGLIGVAIALILGMVVSWQSAQVGTTAQAANGAAAQTGLQSALITQQLNVPDSLLGHLPYEEAPADDLQSVVADNSIKLRPIAAAQFLDLLEAARADGVVIVPISGFRSIADQEQVFFGIKAQQGESPTERAEVSAPPGYSEHHTGYAVDIVDGEQSETDLEISFEGTEAFRWMQQNAARFNFELSFPRDNAEGISYEPWHWRFVGDRHSLETFFKARQLAGSNQE